MLNDTFNSDWQDRLQTFDAIMLVDGVFIPGLHHEIAGLLCQPNRPLLLFESLPACNEDTRDVSPFLFRHEPDNAALAVALEKCSGWPMVSAIKTDEPLPRFAARLTTWCIVENGNLRFNFRFADTRRLPAIFKVLNEGQRRQFVGPAEEWIYIDRQGKWSLLAMPGGPPIEPSPPVLDDHQFGRLVNDSEPDEMIMRLSELGYVLPTPHSRATSMVKTMIAAADAVNLDTDTKLNWCIHCVREGACVDVSNASSMLAKWREESEEKN